MKKLAILLVLLAPLLMAQEIIYTDLATVEWNAVTEFANGDPIPGDHTVSYELFVSDYPVVDAQNPAAHTSLGTTTLTTMDVPVTWDQHRSVGIRTILTRPDLSVAYSGINWSDANGAETPDPFVYVGLQLPARPQSLRTQ